MSEQQKAMDLLNQLAADLGLFPRGRARHTYNFWRIPRNWKGTRYLFGYTPWRTQDPETGKTGFFAVKFRLRKDGGGRCVKMRRFGRRKVAREYSLKWHRQYYEGGEN